MRENEDFFLQNVVQLANENGLSLSITILVSGLLVSGQLIGGAEYYKGQGGDLKSRSTEKGSPSDLLGDFWTGFSAIYDKKAEEDKTAENVSTPVYIHLKNVKILSGANLIPSDSINFWRGKISSVDGFYLGAFS